MQFADGRRTYYDHEIAYQRVREKGGSGWDDFVGQTDDSSYTAVKQFIQSPFATFLGGDRTALDVGCGGGQVAMLLAKTGCMTSGTDFSHTAISIAEANAKKANLKISFFEDDCLTLKSVPERSFDLVTDNHTWHCVIGERDRKMFLRTVKRILKKGGIFFSESITREGHFLPECVDADPATFISRHHNRYWASYEEVREYLINEGFELLYHELRPQPEAPVGSLVVIYAKRP